MANFQLKQSGQQIQGLLNDSISTLECPKLAVDNLVNLVYINNYVDTTALNGALAALNYNESYDVGGPQPVPNCAHTLVSGTAVMSINQLPLSQLIYSIDLNVLANALSAVSGQTMTGTGYMLCLATSYGLPRPLYVTTLEGNSDLFIFLRNYYARAGLPWEPVEHAGFLRDHSIFLVDIMGVSNLEDIPADVYYDNFYVKINSRDSGFTLLDEIFSWKPVLLTEDMESLFFSIPININTINGNAQGLGFIDAGGTADFTLTSDYGYQLPDTITCTNATATYDKSVGSLVISNPTGPVSITVECVERE